ncbi:MAG TPA: histidine kinase [Candidatus Limnocylindrales bacterium]|nr:histidine kinase [Candidatus Limnocylindrales bacterium]
MSPAKREPADESPESAGDLASRLESEIASVDQELTEIDMLVAQARTEAGRHEQKRTQANEKLTTGVNLPAEDVVTLNAQLVTLTRRAAVMEAQVDVLEGKRKTLARFRDLLAELSAGYGGAAAVAVDGVPRLTAGSAEDGDGGSAGAGEGSTSTAAGGGPMSRIVLNAQEDLRREIARAMHDGPAQSLTNIVLQAQIVERLIGRDLDAARAELRLLQAMVQQTLDATKTFIFDVRPMVLDDLGLVPTLRRAARERGRRAGIHVDFDSIGADRRIEVDLESSLFRIIDEALAAYVSAQPDRVGIRLDWTDGVVEAEVSAGRAPTDAMASADRQLQEAIDAAAAGAAGKDLPPALAAMLADRRAQAETAVATARSASVVALPATTWREIQQRAASVGISVELLDDGGRLHLRAEEAAPSVAAVGAGDDPVGAV